MAITKRKPDVIRLDGKNEVKSTSINGCIDFTVQNAGLEKIYIGFLEGQEPDIPLEPGEHSPWPLYRPCEEWEADVYIKFGVAGSVAVVMKTI